MSIPLETIRRVVREVGLALIVAGVIVLLFVVYQLWGTGLTEAHNQSVLARQFKQDLRTATAAPTSTSTSTSSTTSTTTTVPATTVATTTVPPTSTPPTTARSSSDAPAFNLKNGGVPAEVPAGQVVDHLVIPAIGVSKYVVEGTEEDDLRRGPGHYTGTAYPGQIGNTGIAGHRTTYGAPFFELNNLKVGDRIMITDLKGTTWTYVVNQAPVVVSPSDTEVLAPTPYAQLTLTTCNPRYSATSRLVVFARLTKTLVATPPPTAPPTTTPPPRASDAPSTTVGLAADNLGHGNSGAWPPTILYGALVIALWVGVRLGLNRTRRWYKAGTLVGGIGVCLIPLWFCFENVILLLPQSI